MFIEKKKQNIIYQDPKYEVTITVLGKIRKIENTNRIKPL